MNISEWKLMAETLRLWLVELAPLPVKGGELAIDGLDDVGQSMSLQMNDGQQVGANIDGSKTMAQPFTLLYRAPDTSENVDRSAMMGALNAIGDWMTGLEEMPYFGEGINVNRIQQARLASIMEKDEHFIGYAAAYVMEYEIL